MLVKIIFCIIFYSIKLVAILNMLFSKAELPTRLQSKWKAYRGRSTRSQQMAPTVESCDVIWHLFVQQTTKSISRGVVSSLSPSTSPIFSSPKKKSSSLQNGHCSGHHLYRLLGNRRHWLALCRAQGTESRVSVTRKLRQQYIDVYSSTRRRKNNHKTCRRFVESDNQHVYQAYASQGQ